MKFDDDKPRFDLIDASVMLDVARVLMFGANKYGADNWRQGVRVSRLLAAALRHLNAFQQGEFLDQESCLPHTAHAICNLIFLQWTYENRDDLNDLYLP